MKAVILTGGLGTRLAEETTLRHTVDWYRAWMRQEDMRQLTLARLDDYLAAA